MTQLFAAVYVLVGLWVGFVILRAARVATRDPLGFGSGTITAVAAVFLATFWLPVLLLSLAFVAWCAVSPQTEQL